MVDRLLTAPFLFVTLAHLLQALGYASMLLLPLYLVHLGASRTVIGAVMGSAAIGGLALRPLVGWALDRLGRKPTIIAGTLITTAGMALLWFVTELGWMVYVVRVTVGIGTGALFTAYFTLAADIVPASRRTEGIALFGVTGLIPLVVNPLAGELGVAGADLRWFLPLMGLLVLSSLLALAGVPESKRTPPSEPLRLRQILAMLTARPLIPVWVATTIFSSLVAVAMAFAAVTAEARGLSRPALLWATYAGGAAFIRLFGARLPDRLGTHNLVAPALASYAAGMLFLASADDNAGFLLGGLLCGAGHGYCFPVLTSQVVTRTPEHVRGGALALFTGLWDLTYLLLPPALGAMGDSHGDALIFFVSASGAALGLVVWLILESQWGAAPTPPSPQKR
ncbi:MAG: MFS transporter [Myxococcota bacterium]